MNWLFPEERLHYRRRGPFDRHVSRAAISRINSPPTPPLRLPGPAGRIIRGAMDAEEFPSSPCRTRRARHSSSAASAAPIPTSSRPRYGGCTGGYPIRSGARAGLEAATPGAARPAAGLGRVPSRRIAGGRGLPQDAARAGAVQRAAVENWPRVGLEAMAAGVPLVVDAKGGWLEMLRHGRTGYLCRTDNELAYYARDWPTTKAIGCGWSAAPVTL